MTDELCLDCLRPIDVDVAPRHRKPCRTKKCEGCLALPGWPHDGECPRLVEAVGRYES